MSFCAGLTFILFVDNSRQLGDSCFKTKNAKLKSRAVRFLFFQISLGKNTGTHLRYKSWVKN